MCVVCSVLPFPEVHPYTVYSPTWCSRPFWSDLLAPRTTLNLTSCSWETCYPSLCCPQCTALLVSPTTPGVDLFRNPFFFLLFKSTTYKCTRINVHPSSLKSPLKKSDVVLPRTPVFGTFRADWVLNKTKVFQVTWHLSPTSLSYLCRCFTLAPPLYTHPSTR